MTFFLPKLCCLPPMIGDMTMIAIWKTLNEIIAGINTYANTMPMSVSVSS
jgi:hypothetical protein